MFRYANSTQGKSYCPLSNTTPDREWRLQSQLNLPTQWSFCLFLSTRWCVTWCASKAKCWSKARWSWVPTCPESWPSLEDKNGHWWLWLRIAWVGVISFPQSLLQKLKQNSRSGDLFRRETELSFLWTSQWYRCCHLATFNPLIFTQGMVILV